ncbi:kinase-like domain-containing protein [Gautieria morchelliformis]|nr:kinase-like domain-containing protein [Gautieria morchelliformis]
MHMTSSLEFPLLEETWDMVDRSTIDVELFRKVWLHCESYLHSRGYTLAYRASEAYRSIYQNYPAIPRKAPEDPFHPQFDEAFCFIHDRFKTIREPENVRSTRFPTPYAHPALDSRGRRVILKAVPASSMELKVIQLLSSEPLRADPRNHTIPLLEVLDAREWSIIVTPEWGFSHWERCASVEEYLEYARQLFEGLAFMHQNGIIHGDIHDLNVVMNMLENNRSGVFDSVPRDFGPCGAKYAFIDFGESHIVRTEDEAIQHPDEVRFHPKAPAPELLKDDPVNLFSCDVYAVGALLRDHIKPFGSIEPQSPASILMSSLPYKQVIDAITHEEPQRRPTAVEALALFEGLIHSTDLTDSIIVGTHVSKSL